MILTRIILFVTYLQFIWLFYLFPEELIGSSPLGQAGDGGPERPHQNGAASARMVVGANTGPLAVHLPFQQEIKPNCVVAAGSANSLLPVNNSIVSPTKSSSAVSPVLDSTESFAYRDPRLPARWWVSVERLGGELRYGYYSPTGDRLRSPSEVAHYLQACVPYRYQNPAHFLLVNFFALEGHNTTAVPIAFEGWAYR